MNNLIVFLLALLLDLTLKEPPNSLHPVCWMGSFISYLWRKRPTGTKSLFLYGASIVISGSVLFGFLGYIVMISPRYFNLFFAAFLLKGTFSVRALVEAGREVAVPLSQANMERARHKLGWHLVSRDTSKLTFQEVAGAAVESMAENYTDGFIAPLMFFLIGGVPAALVYRFVNTCDSMLGYRYDHYEWGGKFGALLDDLLNWIPARIASVFLILGSAIMGLNWRNGIITAFKHHRSTSSPNAGWTMAAVAGAMEVTLSKRGVYRIVGGLRETGFKDILTMIYVLYISDLLASLSIIFLGCVFIW